MGLWSGVLQLLKIAIQLAVNRLALASLEMALLRREAVIALLLAGLGVSALAIGSVALAALFIFLVWEPGGWQALLLVAAVYFAAAGGLLFLASRWIRRLRAP